MASAEMPGVTAKSATKHMEAGRRKLDEFRKRRADLKSKATSKPISNDLQSEGLNNGPSVAGNGRQNDFNGLDAQPASSLKGKRSEYLFQDSQLDQASSGDSLTTKNLEKDSLHGVHSVSQNMPMAVGVMSSQLEGDSGFKLSENKSNSMFSTSRHSPENHSGGMRSGYEHLSWMEGTEKAESKGILKVSESRISGHASGDENHEPLIFRRKESPGEFQDDPHIRRSVADSLTPPIESLRRGFSHESFSTLREDTDLAAPVLDLVPSAQDGAADSMQEQANRQHRLSWLQNGRRAWDSRESQYSFAQPKKVSILEQTGREPFFQSLSPDKSPFSSSSTLATASFSSPSSTNHQEGLSLPSSLPVQIAVDAASEKGRESDSKKHQEGMQKHAGNDDFAALEQHIDDLTQEKFALQRALDGARSLADSLSQQNSSLTEDFNSQGAIINQLQEELEKKKEEVTAQSLVLSSFMMERERAQQENNSAVERSQILAGEVIGLEEKVLRLRSSELKLQKELENLRIANDSLRVQVATLDKDRQNLQNMLDAMQEDKKLLQSQLQKAFLPAQSDAQATAKEGGLKDSRDASISIKHSEISTQNERTMLPAQQMEEETKYASASVSLPDFSDVNLRSMFATLSPDDCRTVDGIHNLIAELFSEKEGLVDSLQRESARAAEFEEANYELTKKLETQTQRLELAVAQNMAFGGNAIVNMNASERDTYDDDYVDEGDKVVERVLGWIMQIFPGGSSRRQGRKRL